MRRYPFLWQTIFRAFLCLLFLLTLYAGRTAVFPALHAQTSRAPVNTAPIAVAQADAACARCHADITSRYLQTPHAAASGPALSRLISGVFTQASSGLTYSISEQNGAAWLRYTDPRHPGFEAMLPLEQIGRAHV